MAKWFGKIGFVMTKETSPGIYEDVVEEKNYYGELVRYKGRWKESDKINDDIDISNQLSILADRFVYDNFQFIRYIEWMNKQWKVTDVDVEYPRLTLSIGGLYNGDTSRTSTETD